MLRNKKRKQAPKPFEEYLTMPKYFSKSNGRWIATLIHKVTRERIRMNYARFVLAVKLGRKLEHWEDAHHKDKNKLNDDPDNIELKHVSSHRRLHGYVGIGSTKYFGTIKRNCLNCNNEFELTNLQQRQIMADLNKGKSQNRGKFCSHSCSTEYRHRTEPLFGVKNDNN